MSITENDVVDYPESDGQPMGETDLHIYWTVRLRDLLKTHFDGQQVYVGTNLLVYYERGNPTRYVVPDVFAVFDCRPYDRRNFRIWDECRVPNVVFEVSSRSTADIDLLERPAIYAKFGVQEYFLFDPEGDYLDPQLRGFRLQGDRMVEMTPTQGCLQSLLFQCDLKVEDNFLELIDLRTRQPWLTQHETEEIHSEYYRDLSERFRKLSERERIAKETERRAKERERVAKEQERAGRLAAEAEVLRLKAELERLQRD